MTGLKLPSDRRPALPRRVIAAWLAGLVLATALSAVGGERLRHAIFDAWQALSPRDLEDTDVRVVLIDNESVAMVGSWPWSRYYMARLTEELANRQARVIAYDILFSESDRALPETFASLYPELSAGSKAELEGLPTMDAVFGTVVATSPVVLAHAGVREKPAQPPALSATPIVGQPPPNLDNWPGELTAIPELGDVAMGVGLVNAPPDGDGVTRSVPMLLRAGGTLRPSLALETARVATGGDGIRTTSASLRVGAREVPLDLRGRMRLHYGEFPPERIWSAAEILGRSAEIAPDEFAGKTVVVGMSADGTSDIAATPAKAEEFGPLIQAQAVDALLRGGWLERPSWAPALEWAAGAVLALLALGVAIFNRSYRVALAALFVAVPMACWFTFATASTLVDPGRPLVLGLGPMGGAALGLFAVARRDRQRLRDTLVEERVAAAETAGELEAARAIQLGMVPPPDRLRRLDARADIGALLEPAKSVGGDFYDAVKLGDDHLAVAIADVTGKGVPAALFMAMSKALTGAALSQPDRDPAKMIAAINAQLLRDYGEAMSVTMLLVIADLRTGQLQLSCAGHEDPLLVAPSGRITRHRLDGGPPLSIVPFDYPTEALSLVAGDTLLLITDGVTEAQDGEGRLFGVSRLLDDPAMAVAGAQAMCDHVRDQVRTFEDGTEATDDLTVLALRYLGSDISER